MLRNVCTYVLPHEIGHYLGLYHYGHTGFKYLMYIIKRHSPPDPGLASFYVDNEPRFTLQGVILSAVTVWNDPASRDAESFHGLTADSMRNVRMLLEELPECVGASDADASDSAETITRRVPLEPGVA